MRLYKEVTNVRTYAVYVLFTDTRFDSNTCVIQNISSRPVYVCVAGGDTLLFDVAQLLQYDIRLYVSSRYVQLSLCT
jgi:hypothetical protein